MVDRFDNFSENARLVLRLAQEQAHRLNHHYIGPEHLLLGLTGVGGGRGMEVLERLGVKREAIRTAVEQLTVQGKGAPVALPSLNPRAWKVIELAETEALERRCSYVGTEHLLLGILHEHAGIAFGVLSELGVTLENARAEVARLRDAEQKPELSKDLGTLEAELDEAMGKYQSILAQIRDLQLCLPEAHKRVIELTAQVARREVEEASRE